jgi:hypothetical protein
MKEFEEILGVDVGSEGISWLEKSLGELQFLPYFYLDYNLKSWLACGYWWIDEWDGKMVG